MRERRAVRCRTGQGVSIRTRPFGRVMHAMTYNIKGFDEFQSAPGLSAG